MLLPLYDVSSLALERLWMETLNQVENSHRFKKQNMHKINMNTVNMIFIMKHDIDQHLIETIS